MVKCWHIDDREPANEAEKRSERHLNPPEYLTLDQLRQKSGVLYESINVDKYESEGTLAELFTNRGFATHDYLDIHPKRLDNYTQKLEAFYTEHMHNEDELRLVLNGSGYFDIRDIDNRWIRIAVQRGDLLCLPAGSYHRFTLDTNNWIKLFRLFGTKPDWVAYNRPADQHPARVGYLDKAVKGF